MIDGTLYSRERQARNQACLQVQTARWGRILRDAPEPLAGADLLEGLGVLMDMHLHACDETPAGTLDRLKRRARRRMWTGAFVGLGWLVMVVFGGGLLLACFEADGRAALLWGTGLLVAIVSNRVLLLDPIASTAEREQFGILLSWDRDRSCRECGHGPHVPGGCPWGIHGSSTANDGRAAACPCGSLDCPPEVDNTRPCA